MTEDELNLIESLVNQNIIFNGEISIRDVHDFASDSQEALRELLEAYKFLQQENQKLREALQHEKVCLACSEDGCDRRSECSSSEVLNNG